MVLVSFSIVGIMAYYDVLPAPLSAEYQYCRYNPEECVCEEWEEQVSNDCTSPVKLTSSGMYCCEKLKVKTPEEKCNDKGNMFIWIDSISEGFCFDLH